MAKADGYRAALEQWVKIQRQAEERLETLVVRINSTKTQLAMLPMQRNLLRAQVLSDAGQHLVAQVDRLLEGNRQIIQGNPVRSVADLIAVPTEPAKPRSSLQAARDFLAAEAELVAREPSNVMSRHVERILQRDLDKLQKTRQDLDGEIGALSRKRREQQALADQAATLAEEFRQAYQTAAAKGGFPVTVRHAAYTQEQVESQVSLLLAESEGYRDAVVRLDDVRGQAEVRLEALTVQINTTQTQLAALPTQRELLRARVLSDEGEQLVAHVDRLLDVNHRVIQGNPVRGVAELIAAPTPAAERRSNLSAARAYLAGGAEVAASTQPAP